MARPPRAAAATLRPRPTTTRPRPECRLRARVAIARGDGLAPGRSSVAPRRRGAMRGDAAARPWPAPAAPQAKPRRPRDARSPRSPASASTARSLEAAAGAVVARHRIEEVVRPLLGGLVGHLASPGLTRHHAVGQAGRQLRAEDRLDRREAQPVFPPRMVCGMVDGVGDELGLEDRRHRLRPSRHLVARPVELRRVDRRQLHRASASTPDRRGSARSAASR